MVGWFARRAARKAAWAINETCHAALHARDIGIGADNFLGNHPFKVREVPAVERSPIGHQFWLGKELASFQINVPTGYDGEQFITVFGRNEYLGCDLIATQKGRYQVSLSPPLSRPLGSRAYALMQAFEQSYNAMNTTSPDDLNQITPKSLQAKVRATSMWQ